MHASKKISVAAIALGLLLAVAGCTPSAPAETGGSSQSGGSGSGDAPAGNAKLDDYVAAESKQIDAIIASSNGQYSDVSIDAVYPGTVSYSYTYAAPVDAATASSYFDSKIPDFQDACDTGIFPAMTQYGVTGDLGVTYTYFNSDGSTIWTHDFVAS